jgi:phosphoglycerate kinase
LGAILGGKSSVSFATDCIGQEVQNVINNSLQNGEILVLENVRFYAEEEQNDAEFAGQLASLADIYVNDAFGTAHRAHASTEGIAQVLRDNCVGFLMEKELDYLEGAVEQPSRPFAAIVGGSKVSSKITVIESLLNKVNVLIIGGGMVFTFLRARGINTGASMVEEDKISLAQELEKVAQEKGVELILPVDVIVADKFAPDANTQVVNVKNIPDGWMGLDQGPETTTLVNNKLRECNTIIWNGPVGVFEMDAFAQGTFAIANTLADLTKEKNATTIVGGGDSVAAVQKAGLGDKLSHISTGGGASLELLEGKVLPGVAAIQSRDN